MIGELFVKIGADFKDLEKGFESAQKKIGDFGKKTENLGKGLTKNITAPILAVGGGLLAMGIKVGNTADRILDLNAITGMTTDAIQEWQFVTKEAGVSTEAVTNATQKLTKQMFSLENDSGKAAESFEKLGLNFEEFNDLSADKRIETLINRLGTIEDETERARIGTELLGGSWQDIAPIVALGADAISNARQEARDMGAVMDGEALNAANDFRIQMEKLKTQFQVAGREIGMKFLPILSDTLVPLIQNNILPLIDKLINFVVKWIDKFMALDDKTKNIIFAMIGILAILGPVIFIVGKIIAIFSIAIGIFKTVAIVILALFSPIGLIVIAIAGLVTAGVLLYKNWDIVKEKLSNIFNSIKNTTKSIFGDIKNFVLNIFSSINVGIMNQINKIRSAIDSVLGFFRKTKDTIDRFTGGAKGAISSAGGILKTAIPFLAEGGIVTRPTLAMIGEGGESEAVIPLSKLAGLSGNNQTHIYLDGKEITRTVAPQMVDMLRTKLAY